MADTDTPTPTKARGWLRRYPPLVTFAVALVIMLVIMPSALNLPQSNPTTVLEYAPIPPEDEDQPPPQEGSLSTLGLGTSDTLETGAAADDVKPTKPGEGTTTTPIVKRCVDDPDTGARQTEDPNAPPCVPFFTGDNGGATFRGVTKDEIKVVLYTDAYQAFGGDSGYESTPPSGEICDVDSEPDDTKDVGCMNGEGTSDGDTVQVARALSKYFNERYQTYDRHVHFYIYWSAASGPTGRRSDVQDIYERIGPYSVIDYTIFGDAPPMIEAAIKRQMTVYGSFPALPNKTYRENAPYLWGFWPDVEHSSALFYDYFCKRVAPFKVNHSGNADDMGKERKYGLLNTSDQSYPGQRYFASVVKEKLKKGCPTGPVNIVGEYTYPINGFSVQTDPEQLAKAQKNVALMQNDEVTTVVWLNGYDADHSKSASAANYFPEWVVAGDLTGDQTEEGATQDQEAWQYAWTMSHYIREDKLEEAPCHQAVLEGDPYVTPEDELAACALYRGFFMLFRGIQVAGPFLTPDAVDQGNHQIARVNSTDPRIAACFFDPGDYTCVKDSQESWWDPDVENPNGDATLRGCWRMSAVGSPPVGGRRFLAGNWPQGDDVFKRNGDVPCNTASDNAVNIN